MNSLSWLIYFAGFVDSLGGFFELTEILSAIIVGISFFIWMVNKAEVMEQKSKDVPFFNQVIVDLYVNTTQIAWNFFKYSFIVFISVMILNVIIPSKKTVILIAASEIGERVVTNKQFTDKVGSVVDPSIELLQTYIQKETLSIQKDIDSIKNPEVKK
jgi:hypothetical protein